jgi:hypothetical protein
MRKASRGVFECCVDVHNFQAMAVKGLNRCKGFFMHMLVDVCVVLEAQGVVRLPGRIVGMMMRVVGGYVHPKAAEANPLHASRSAPVVPRPLEPSPLNVSRFVVVGVPPGAPAARVPPVLPRLQERAASRGRHYPPQPTGLRARVG